jgi:hypothetical protein
LVKAAKSFYVMAGGAALYVTTPSAIGATPADAITIDPWNLDPNNLSDPRDHLRPTPADGTFLNDSRGRRYRMAGRAALTISDCTPLGGCPTAVLVDPAGC